MSTTTRRTTALAVLLAAAALLSACADATGPAPERSGATANTTCETQGSNTRC